MAKQAINIGSSANDGAGDPLRTAFTKINENFVEVYTELGGSSLSNISFTGNTIGTDDTNGNILLSPNGTGAIVIDTSQNLQFTSHTDNAILKFDASGNVAISSIVDDGTTVAMNNLSINGTTVSTGGTALSNVNSAINAANITGVSSSINATTGNLDIFHDGGELGDSTNREILDFEEGTGLLAGLGFTAGNYRAPKFLQDKHTNRPTWKTADENRPTGSIWFKTTSANSGANIVLVKFLLYATFT